MKPSALVDWRAVSRNPGELAATMLRVIDDSPQHVAVLAVAHEAVPTDDAADAMERVTIREYERAKAERPNLGIKVCAPTDEHPDAALLVVMHEHRWVGGRCVNGCTDTREAA
jgi:hypothetical protein